MKVLLHSPEYRPNLSSMIRTAEFYGLKEIYIYDYHQILKAPENKKGKADMNHLAKVWTAGAVDHITIHIIENDIEFITQYPSRTIATALALNTTDIHQFKFENEDLLIMGNEKEGLPEEILSLVDNTLMINNKGITNCLNVAVSFGIFLHQAVYQTTK